ncbi:hypothetical protein ACF1CG_34750 [Streptomyces sp. NPDC014773]|uniref:hypothetical protein n=1 Tax=Streptomyces sp. NPDC014773 TaxID=3364908 RepID=UPI0036FEA4E5
MAQQELDGMSLANLRWARTNDPEFPAVIGKTGQEYLYRFRRGAAGAVGLAAGQGA